MAIATVQLFAALSGTLAAITNTPRMNDAIRRIPLAGALIADALPVARAAAAAGEAVLTLDKSGPAAVLNGNDIVYTVTVYNAGPGDAVAITIYDLFPKLDPEVRKLPWTGVDTDTGGCKPPGA